MKKSNTVADLKTKFAEYNPRTITDEQLKNLKRSLKKFGDLSGVVLNVRSGNIVGGHQRLKSLDPKWTVESKPHTDNSGTVALGYIQTDDGRFQYREVDWDAQTEKAANLAANKHGGEFDLKKLEPMLKDLKDSGFDLSLAGFGDDESSSAAAGDDTEPIEPPADPRTKLGDLYLLGDHRLLCGDSTNAEDVARLMDGKKADMVFTDPPYGIGIDGQKKSVSKNPKQSRKAHDFKDWDRSRIGEDFFKYVTGLNIPSIIFGGNYYADILPASRGWIYWDKGQNGLTMSDGELAWTNQDKPLRAVVCNRANIGKSVHPTQKPLQVVKFCLDYIEGATIVLDFFAGSGSTLIACDNLNRKCYGMELDPAYCDVIIDRWERHTGKKATLEKA